MIEGGKVMYYPALEDVRRYAEGGKWVPVWREVVADLETPVSAFLKVHCGGPCFLLESVEGGQRLARYSFIGTEPYLVRATRGEDDTDPLEGIAMVMSKFDVAHVPGLPRLCGGAVGYLSYEAAQRFERLPSPASDSLELPESYFMFVHTLLVYDHVTHTIRALSHVKPEGDLERSYAEAVARIDSLLARLQKPLDMGQPNRNPLSASAPLRSNRSRDDFEAAVSKVKDLISEGEAIQVVLSQRLSRPSAAAPFEIYRALRTINPSPYMFYLDCGEFQLVGASPEILVRVEGGKVATRPLAGTRRRGRTADEDLMLEQELRTDEKERAEHIMLVDLGRNDIGRVSEPGSVVVSDLMDVERYSHVMHLVTHVEGKLRSDVTALDALRACFPAGTVSGAPKVRAMELIAELEPEKRGPYAGAVGYLSYSGNLDMAITIRTMVIKDGVVHAQSGCGIVYDSVPCQEFEETMNKARALLKAIDQAEAAQRSKEASSVAAHR